MAVRQRSDAGPAGPYRSASVRPHTVKSSRPALGRLIWHTAPLLILLLLTTLLFWWYLLGSGDKLRHATISQAQLRAQQVNVAVSQAASMMFFNVDQAAIRLIESFQHDSRPVFNAKVAAVLKGFPRDSILQIGVIDADGYLSYSNLRASDRIYLGDREHFRAHLDRTDNELFISKPMLGRVSHQWTIQFSKPIRSEGQFRGVFVMSVATAYLHDKLVTLQLGDNDTISILRTSGDFLARDRNQHEALRSPVPKDRPYIEAQPGESGFFTTSSSVDRVERMFHWIRLSDYPVVISLGLSERDILSPVDAAITQDKVRGLLVTASLWCMAIWVILLMSRMMMHAERKMAFEHAAHHDSLTGLKNRAGLIDRLNAMTTGESAPRPSFWVLFMDLDGFKPINDQHGHAVGDEILRAVARRLDGCVRNGDLVARMGGDEFVVISQSAHAESEAQALANRIHATLASPIQIGTLQLTVGISIGMAQYPHDGTSTDELLAKSDQAMYTDKRCKAA